MNLQTFSPSFCPFALYFSFRALFWGTFDLSPTLLVAQEMSVVGQQQRGGRKGDDHAHKPEQTAPNGQREQDDGRAEAHDLVHDAGDEDGLLDDLDDEEHDACRHEYPPEVVARVGRLDQRKKHRGHEGDGLQVGHDIEQPHEEPEADGQGEVDDHKADAEEDAHTQGHERLATKVVAHAVLDIVGQAHHAVAIALGDEPHPPAGKALIVIEDEQDIDHEHEHRDEPIEQAERLGHDIPYLGQGSLSQVADALDGEVALEGGHVDVTVHKLIHHIGDGGIVVTRGEIPDDQLLEHRTLLHDGRDHQVAHPHEKGRDEDQDHKHREQPVAEPETILEELHRGVYQVAKQPGDEEGQQHTAQPLHQQVDTHAGRDGDDATDKQVKCDLLFHNDTIFALMMKQR